MPGLPDKQIRDLAVMGARQKLKELAEEMAQLRKFIRQREPEYAVVAEKERPRTRKPRRPKAKKLQREVTPEERQAISERMKKYWAKRRGKAKTGKSGSRRKKAASKPQ